MSGDPLNYTYIFSATPSPTSSWGADTEQRPSPAMARDMQGYYMPFTSTPSLTTNGLVDPNVNLVSPPLLDIDLPMLDCIPDSWTDLEPAASQSNTWYPDQSETHNGNDDMSRRRQHTCPYCLRQMTRRHNLKVHMETHLPNRPRRYVCLKPGCGKQYTRRHDQKRHMATHHGEQSGAPSMRAGDA